MPWTLNAPTALSTYSGRLLANLAAGGWLARTEHQASQSAGVTQNFRVQTFVQRDWAPEMLRFVGGDFDTRSGPLSRSYSLGGISFGRAFDLHPGLVTSPTARMTGIASSASTAEIFVDGLQVATRQLQPGPYDFRNLQDFAGMRNVEVVIRDASGVRERIRVPFYFTERLLSKGLTDFNLSWGAQRSASLDSYGIGTFSGYVFHGVTDRLTLGVEAQRSSGYAFGALAAGFRADPVGVFSGQVAAQRLGGAETVLAGTFAWNYTRGGTTLRALARGYQTGYGGTSSEAPGTAPGALAAGTFGPGTFNVVPNLRRETTVGWDQSLGWTLLLSLSATDRRYENSPSQRDYGVSLSAGVFGMGNLTASVLRTCTTGAAVHEPGGGELFRHARRALRRHGGLAARCRWRQHVVPAGRPQRAPGRGLRLARGRPEKPDIARCRRRRHVSPAPRRDHCRSAGRQVRRAAAAARRTGAGWRARSPASAPRAT